MTVADALRDSRDAHRLWQNESPHAIPAGAAGIAIYTGNADIANAAFYRALRSLAEAHQSDPQHTDPAWHESAGPFTGRHDALLDFYVSQMAK